MLQLLGFTFIYIVYLTIWINKTPTFKQTYSVQKTFLLSTSGKTFFIVSLALLSFLCQQKNILADFGFQQGLSFKYVLIGLAIGVGLLFLFFLIGGLLQHFLKNQEKTANTFFQSFPPNTAYLWILLLAIQASTLEEPIFRGYLLNLLVKIIPIGAAVFIQALLFGIAHFKQGLHGILQNTLIGLIWGILVITFNSLLVSIAAHFAIDWLGLTLQYWTWSKKATTLPQNKTPTES